MAGILVRFPGSRIRGVFQTALKTVRGTKKCQFGADIAPNVGEITPATVSTKRDRRVAGNYRCMPGMKAHRVRQVRQP